MRITYECGSEWICLVIKFGDQICTAKMLILFQLKHGLELNCNANFKQ